MAFRTDKKRGSHPITPRKGIKETDLSIREKGVNDKITVAIKPGNKKTDDMVKDKVKPEDLIAEIIWHMRNDDNDQVKDSEEIKYMYSRLNPEIRNVLDNFYIAITGWSLGTIIEHAKKDRTTIQNEIINLHDENDDDMEKSSKFLYQTYKRMPSTDKQAVDYMMIHTTGYQMNSILQGKTNLANKPRPTDWDLPPSERRPDD